MRPNGRDLDGLIERSGLRRGRHFHLLDRYLFLCFLLALCRCLNPLGLLEVSCTIRMQLGVIQRGGRVAEAPKEQIMMVNGNDEERRGTRVVFLGS